MRELLVGLETLRCGRHAAIVTKPAVLAQPSGCDNKEPVVTGFQLVRHEGHNCELCTHVLKQAPRCHPSPTPRTPFRLFQPFHKKGSIHVSPTLWWEDGK